MNGPIIAYRGNMGVQTTPAFTNTYSLLFDGIGDRVQLASDFVASGEFTISFWMKPTSFSGNGNIFPIGTFPVNANWIRLTSAGVLWFRIGAQTLIYSETVYGGGANDMVLNTWQHIAFIRDSSNNIKCYRNGADFGYNASAATNSNTLTYNSFGRIITNAFGFSGGLDEISFFDTDQTSNLATIYNSGTPNDLSSLSPLNWYRCGENGAYKSPQWLIPNNENFIANKLSNYSFQFDGIDDYISVTANPLTDFTVSFWVKPNSAGASYEGILGQGTTSAQGGILRYVAWNSSSVSGTISLFLGSWTNISGTVTNGVWTNIVLTYDSTLDELKSYNNGSLYTTISSPNFSAQTTNAHSFERIGLRNGVNSSAFGGSIDEVALWDSALTDISSIYNGGEPTTISGAIAHWKMGDEATFSGGVWTIPDQVGSNNGTSNAMTIEDRIGDAPKSENNALSYNMDLIDRQTDTPPT